MRRRSRLVVVIGLAFALTTARLARAGDWEVTLGVGQELGSGIHTLSLEGEVLFVLGRTSAWAVDAKSGRTLATFENLPASGTHPREPHLGSELVAVRAGDADKVFALASGAVVAERRACCFAASGGALFVLQPAGKGPDGQETPARLERLDATGAITWTSEPEPALRVAELWVSDAGVVAAGLGGFTEYDPQGQVLRNWTIPGEEFEHVASTVQVAGGTIVVTLQRADGSSKLFVYDGRRAHEVVVAGLKYLGVVPLNYDLAKSNPNDRDIIRRVPLVAARGRRRYAFVEVAPDSVPGLPAGAVGLQALDLERASLGPKVMAQPRFLGPSGFVFQTWTQGTLVDVVSGRPAGRPGGSAVDLTESHWYRREANALTFGSLSGGEPRTIPLPHASAFASVFAFHALPDRLALSGGGHKSRSGEDVVVGSVDLQRGRVEILVQLPADHFAQLADYEADDGSVYSLVYCEDAAEKGSYRLFRRSRRAR